MCEKSSKEQREHKIILFHSVGSKQIRKIAQTLINGTKTIPGTKKKMRSLERFYNSTKKKNTALIKSRT